MDEVFRSQESEPGNQDIDDPVADSCDPHASEVDNDPIEEEASAGNDPVEDLDTGWYVMRNPIYPCDIVENNEGLSIINHDAQSPKSSSARNIPLDEPDNDNNVVAFQLLRHFQETLGGWMDVFDTTGYFSRRIPLLASNNELLKYSICSISAKHLQRIYGGEEVLFDRLGGVVENGEIDYEYLSVAYYDKAITRLKPRVESLAANEMLIHSSASTEEILAAIAILCQYELMDTPGVAWTVHLGAVHLLVKEARIDIPECSIVTVPRAAIQGPVFWSLARQDILCACIGETQTRLKIENLQLWHHAGLASADNHLQPPTSPGSLTEYSSVSDIPEDMKAKDLICMLSKLINFVTAGDALVPEDYARPEGHRLTVAVAQELLLKRWQAIEIDLRHWHTTLPSSFVPKTYAKGDLQTALSQKVPHKTFPKICYEAPICAAAILSFHMACILLYSNRPQESTAIRSTVSARLQSYREDARHALFHARQICGIVVLERSATVLVHAVHPLFLAGQVFIDQDEQQAVIILLENIEQSFGWSTSYLIQKLREDWDARSLR